MRLSFSDLKNAHFRYIGKANQFNDTTLMTDFQYSLGQRYQMIMGSLSSYLNQDTQTASTVAAQQDYTYPVATVGADSATIIIGSVRYTLSPVYSQESWNMLNALQMQPTSIPQFIFIRKDDFGIWPIPQDVYTIEFNRFFRDRNLLIDDYSTGTVTLTQGDATATLSGGTFTNAMVGRWFTITDLTKVGQGYWYRVGSVTDSTHIELEGLWAAANITGATYRIGESPEIPEEAHVILPLGTASDFYAGIKNDPDNATRFDNAFYTGSYVNTSRSLDDKGITAGLIGMIRRYKDRDREHLVQRQPRIMSPVNKIWASQIT